MKKFPLIFCLLAICGEGFLFSQPCINDTVRTHAQWYPDTTEIQMPIPCATDTCDVSCAASLWLDMPDTSGVMAIRANVGQTVQIEIYDGCHWLLYRECRTFAFSPVIAWEMFVDWAIKPYTIRICAAQLAGLELMFKPGKIDSMPPTDTLQLIDTLCGPLGSASGPLFPSPHKCKWKTWHGIEGILPLDSGLWCCTVCRRKIIVP